MQLFNQTPLAARVDTSEVAKGEPRIGVLTAKATFRFDLSGNVELETQNPMPLFVQDQPTPLGLIPHDFEPRRNRAFEVILLGHAHAPQGRPTESMRVALSVGSERRELVVTGERAWVMNGQGAPTITRPLSFTRMPLTYQHAFGGKQTIKLDAATDFDIFDPVNPHGRGFDAQLAAARLGELLQAPAGYPRLDGYRRLLPNLEDPGFRVQHWDDAPEPACWATTPIDVNVQAARLAQQLGKTVPPEIAAPVGEEPEVPAFDAVLCRCHPDWVLAIPDAAPTIRLENLLGERNTFELRLPDQRVVADYVVEGRSGTRPLLPHRLLLLPDELRVSLLYRLPFTFKFAPGDERAFRLRLEPGWFGGEVLQ